MATTYSVNQFDEVVPCYDGRTSNSTTDRRYTTDFEKQLLEEIKELKIELDGAKANPVENRVVPKIAEMLIDLEREIASCEMEIAGGNSMNVKDALQTLSELKKLLSNFSA